jgi:hypothetical protein
MNLDFSKDLTTSSSQLYHTYVSLDVVSLIASYDLLNVINLYDVIVSVEVLLLSIHYFHLNILFNFVLCFLLI